MTPPFLRARPRLLPERRRTGPMPWVIAIMMFLMVLAGAAGLGLTQAARALGSNLQSRLTIQIIEPDAGPREAQTRAALAALAAAPGVRTATRVSPAEMQALLEPWLGPDALADDLPLPAMIDVTLAGADATTVAALLRPIAPAARIDDHSRSLAPLARLIEALRWVAAALVLLVAAATAAPVVLAARAALDTHRATIDVMHLLGATDRQIADLFQRRIARDALLSGFLGFVAAALVIALLAGRLTALGSELLGALVLPAGSWAFLLLLPIAGTLLAMAVARWTVLAALRRIL
jgi:cell division transport system permease protein